MAIEYHKRHPVKITPEHQEFMTRLVDSGEFVSKADIARKAIDTGHKITKPLFFYLKI